METLDVPDTFLPIAKRKVESMVADNRYFITDVYSSHVILDRVGTTGYMIADAWGKFIRQDKEVRGG